GTSPCACRTEAYLCELREKVFEQGPRPPLDRGSRRKPPGILAANSGRTTKGKLPDSPGPLRGRAVRPGEIEAVPDYAVDSRKSSLSLTTFSAQFGRL